MNIPKRWFYYFLDGDSIESGFSPMFPELTNIDVYSRLRVSSPKTIFESKQIGYNDPMYWSNAVTGGGSVTYNILKSASTLAVDATNFIGYAVRQSKKHLQYQFGKSKMFLCSANFGAQPANSITKRIGLFNDTDGVFFEYNQTGFYCSIRSDVTGSVVDTAFERVNWNIDKLDGTGTSGTTLDLLMSQIFVIDFEWGGLGYVRFGVYIGGKVVYCHQIDFTNALVDVYSKTPNVPIRYEVNKPVANTTTASILVMATAIIAEGDNNTTFNRFSVQKVTSTILASGFMIAVAGIRLKAGFESYSLFVNDIDIVDDGLPTSSGISWGLYLNPAIAGVVPGFTSVGAHSVAESRFFSSTANVVSGGVLITAGFGNKQQSDATIINKIGASVSINNAKAYVYDELVLACRPVLASNSMQFAINFSEVV